MIDDPEEINALADRIDHEELWRRSPLDDSLTPEQKDRLRAGIALRRYASQRNAVKEARKVGAEYIRGHRLERADNISSDRFGCGTHDWHVALNQKIDGETAERFMYTAKRISDEVPRMVLQFAQERKGLRTTYKMCAHDPKPATELPDNHYRCALGKQTRNCPYLARIESSEKMTNEAKDEAKAWTCATHLLLESKPDAFIEAVLRDKSDDEFDMQMLRSL